MKIIKKVINLIKQYFSDWNMFELVYLFGGVFISIFSSIIFKGTIIDTLYTSLYLITSILLSKGKVESYFIGVFGVFFYGIVSYNQGYYGELLITIFLTFPIMIWGIVEWLRHMDDEENVVIVSTLTKKEIMSVLIMQIPLFFVYYYILNLFNTEIIIISTLSVVTSVLASYFEARRSELSLFCYILNDLIIITLWGIPIVSGQINLISVLVGPILLLVNDIYGSYNWTRIKKSQKIRNVK